METMTLSQLETKVSKKEENYHIDKNGDYKCNDCKTDILCITVIFPIHDGPFPMSGSGKTTIQNFSYCPKCEEKPEIHGLPI